VSFGAVTFLELVTGGLVRMEWAILVYFFVVNLVYGTLLCAAALEMRRFMLRTRGRSMERTLSSPLVPAISVLAPAYNEEATIVASVRALLALHYPNLEVVVISDGSSDRTVELVEQAFELVSIAPTHQHRLHSPTHSRRVSLPYAPPAGGRRQGERREGGRPQRRAELRHRRAGLRHRRGYAGRGRRPPAHGPALPLRGRPPGGGRHDPRGEQCGGAARGA
jgi:cellulose synthase/poly-beta-1,6-N-acetylglucosamine synthase-like glycosyltransferase